VKDEEIVLLVQKGEKEKYGEIIERYWGKLERYLREICNQRGEVVEDLVEETLIKGYEKIQSFDRGRKFSSWIYRIGHNVGVDFIKKKKESRLSEWSEENTVDGTINIEDREVWREKKEELHKAIQSLEEKYKEAVWLYYFEDKSYDEIADILETTTNNVGVLIKRAKDKLRKLISK